MMQLYHIPSYTTYDIILTNSFHRERLCLTLPKEIRTASQKITVSLKGLRDHLQENEQPIINIPGIWDNGQQNRSTACDIVLTNQRLLGYYKVSFPRERLFLDTLPLSSIRTVILQQKKDPVFRELMVGTTDRKVYIRSPRQKIELLNTALQSTIEQNVANISAKFETAGAEQQGAQSLIQERPGMRQPMPDSPLNITLLFTGGLFLEVLGILLWSGTHSAQIGVPLVIAGFVSWLAAMFLRKKRQG